MRVAHWEEANEQSALRDPPRLVEPTLIWVIVIGDGCRPICLLVIDVHHVGDDTCHRESVLISTWTLPPARSTSPTT